VAENAVMKTKRRFLRFSLRSLLLLMLTPVTDPSPLAGLTSLGELDLTGTAVSPESVQRLKKALPQCTVDFP